MTSIHLALPAKDGVCRLSYAEQPHEEFPMGAGWMTQVCDLFPMRIRDPGGGAFIAANMIPMLADALAKMGEVKVPRGVPAPLDRPVWAQLAPELLGFIESQVAGFHTRGRFGWMDTLREARDLFAPQRRAFFPASRDDVDSFLPIYREAYGESMTREQVEAILRGD